MSKRSVGWFGLFGLLLLAVFTVVPAHGVILQWDPNPETNVVGYRVYYGPASRSYVSSNDVYAPLTTATISNLQRDQKYFFAVTAFDPDGLESDYSDEVWIVLTNGAPVAANSSIETLQNQPASIVLTGSDPDADALQFSVVAPPLHGTLTGLSPNLTYTPAPGFYGTDNFQFVASDGYTNSVPANVLINVTPVLNGLPALDPLANISINEDSGDTIVALSGIAPGLVSGLQTLTVTALSDNPNVIPDPRVSFARFQSTGMLAIRPTANAWGTANITVTVNDAGNTVSRTFVVTVNPVNDIPFFDYIANVSVDEDSGITVVPVTGISSGASNEIQTLTLTAISGNTNIIAHPIVTYTSPEGSALLAFRPLPNQWGSVRVRVMLSDGISRVSRFFTVTVRNIEDPPTLNPIASVIVSNTAPLKVPLTGISSGASNEDQTLTVTAVSDNPSVVPNPSVSYASPAAWGSLTLQAVTDSGEANITVTVSDGVSSVARSFGVTVNTPNRPPIVNAGLDQVVTLSAKAVLSGTAMDDGMPRSPGALTVTWTQISGAGAANLSTPDSLTCDVTFPKPGDYVLRLTVSDGAASSSDEVHVFVTDDVSGPAITDFSALAVDARTLVVNLHTDRPTSSTVIFSIPGGAETTNVESMLSTNHVVVLTNLEPDVSYTLRALCTDADGATSTTNDIVVRTPPVTSISANAISATTIYPMIFSVDPLEIYSVFSTTDEAGTAVFNIPVPMLTGYTMWCRIRTPGPDVGSFYLASDGEQESVFDAAAHGSTNNWRWVPVRDLTDSTGGLIPRVWWLTAEVHRFVFRSRIAETYLSDVLLTNDPSWVP